jgi:hypothetical protein
VTQPDYPLPVLPSYEMYQLAHIATYVADALARRRIAGGDAAALAAAERDIAGGRVAWYRATGGDRPIPMPIDPGLFHAVRQSVSDGPRWARAESLARLGLPGWAVVGFVPGVGHVGARVGDASTADALHHHLMTRPATELAGWAVADRATAMPPPPSQIDLAAVAHGLDPRSARDQAVARHLRGADSMVDRAIGQRFAGIDLGAPPQAAPPPRPGAPAPATDSSRGRARPRPAQPAARRAAQAPITRPGP